MGWGKITLIHSFVIKCWQWTLKLLNIKNFFHFDWVFHWFELSMHALWDWPTPRVDTWIWKINDKERGKENYKCTNALVCARAYDYYLKLKQAKARITFGYTFCMTLFWIVLKKIRVRTYVCVYVNKVTLMALAPTIPLHYKMQAI